MRRSFILLFGLVSLGGCATAVVGAVGAVGVAAVQDRTIGGALDDASTSSQVKSRLLSASPKRYAEVDVEVAGKIVLLTGRVPTQADKDMATDIAWSVDLVEDVANELQVRESGGLSQNANDEWITARVRTKLLTDGQVKSVNINIETYDGVVYLMGLVRTPEELERAATLAAKVKGVKEVVSFMEVKAGRAIDQTAVQNERYDPNSYK